MGYKKRPTGNELQGREVALLTCNSYSRKTLKETIDALLKGVSFSVTNGGRIFLKPNLVSGTSKNGLACTNAQFVASMAEWVLDHGASVSVGDSPAFGKSRQVMEYCGMGSALKGLPVTRLNLQKKRKILLDCGVVASISEDIFECDQLINLPKVKAHSQMRVSLAVKNLFGAVVGCRKALAHMRYGERGSLFEALLVDLVSVLPTGVTVMDGIVAMHRSGPVNGETFHLGIAGASQNPVALDTAMLKILGVEEKLSPLWLECQRRRMVGTDVRDIFFPLLRPESLHVKGFMVPDTLDPVRFQIGRFIKSGLRRVFDKSKE